MRTICHYSERPEEREFQPVGNGKRAYAYYRENIESHALPDEEGGERTEWTAVEYSTIVTAVVMRQGFADELRDAIVRKETETAATEVREKRNKLLLTSDSQVLPDRAEEGSARYEAWADYRQALRDIPEQEGFPFDIDWPVKPE